MIKHFHREVEQLTRDVLVMGGLAETAVSRALRSFLEVDTEAAKTIIDGSTIMRTVRALMNGAKTSPATPMAMIASSRPPVRGRSYSMSGTPDRTRKRVQKRPAHAERPTGHSDRPVTVSPRSGARCPRA